MHNIRIITNKRNVIKIIPFLYGVFQRQRPSQSGYSLLGTRKVGLKSKGGGRGRMKIGNERHAFFLF